MGCASSSPLFEKGKAFIDNAKDSANDIAAKGEHVLHDAGETAKDGMEHVKEAVESAVATVETSIGSMTDKISDTFHHKSTEAQKAVDDLETVTEDTANQINESITEEISEAETVLASEVENAKSTIATAENAAFKKVDYVKDNLENSMKDVKENVTEILELEDLDEKTEEEIAEMDNKMERVKNRLPTPAPTPPPAPEVEAKKQEPLTLWEAAADKVYQRRLQYLLEKPPSIAIELVDSEDEPDHKIEFESDIYQKPIAEEYAYRENVDSSEKTSVQSY